MHRSLALELIAIVLFLFPKPASAASYQQCAPSADCLIGEFLYDDAYAPLPGQTCTLNAKDPAGTAFLTNQTMTDRGDGWYSYNATIGTTTGLYSATICCTPSGSTMCLDKSFEVKATLSGGSSLTAAEVWSYSGRTLTGYGTLVADIWGYSTRSLTSFGSLVSDLWSYSGRTLTSFGSLLTDILGTGTTASPTTITSVVAEQTEQRALLEKLVNTPIVSLSLSEGSSIPDLEIKLEESKKQAGLLYDTVSSVKSRLLALDAKWERLSGSAASQEIAAISSLLQNNSSLKTLNKSWDTPALTQINLDLEALKTELAALLTATSLRKTASANSSLLTSLTILSDLESNLGDVTSDSGEQTLFGYLAGVSDRNENLTGEQQKLSALLENLNGQGLNKASREVDAIKSRLLGLNQYPGGASLASPAKVNSDPKRNLKNILYSLQALVGLNRQLLAMNVGEPIRSLWLEEGSIIFRAVITNPSPVISQSVPLKFYLPRELKTEDILELDPSLSTTYDSTEEALYVSGTYLLNAGETKLVYVEVEDIWTLSDEEIESLRKQAEGLLKPLEKTAYFSQGTTLKSDIDVTLDKILLTTGKAVTPENRIRAYREAKLELAGVKTNMQRLEDLVAQSSGTGSLFGFVGGVQTVAVWGIILVIVSGFIGLALYFKKLQPESSSKLVSKPVRGQPVWQLPAIITTVMIVTAAGTVFLTRLANNQFTPSVNEVTDSPRPEPTESSEASESAKPVRKDINVESEKSVLGEDSQTTK